MDPLSRSALTEKHGKHDGFPCRAWLVAIVALENLRHQASKGSEKQTQRLALFQMAHCRKVLECYRCYRLIFGKPGSEAWNSDCKSSAARKNKSFLCVSADCSYRMQSHVLDSSSGKRNAAAVSAKDSSPPWHMSNTHSANICG